MVNSKRLLPSVEIVSERLGLSFWFPMMIIPYRIAPGLGLTALGVPIWMLESPGLLQAAAQRNSPWKRRAVIFPDMVHTFLQEMRVAFQFSRHESFDN